MTMHITPSRPSMAGLNETTAIRDWQARRYGQTSIPASSMVRLEGAPKQWTVTRFGETGVTNWDIPPNSEGMGSRRTWKRSIPDSSLMGLGSLGRHVGTAAERRWGTNPLAETTYVANTSPRRAGMQRFYSDDAWHEQAALSGFSGLGADLDMNVATGEVQKTLRKLGICAPGGRVMAVDGAFGPITNAALTAALATFNQTVSPPLPAERAWQGASNAGTIRMSSNFWTSLQTAAAGHIDQCSGASTSSGGGSGSGSDGQAPDVEIPDADAGAGDGGSWYTNPVNWLKIAAVAGIAFVGYELYQDSQQPSDEFPMLPSGGDW